MPQTGEDALLAWLRGRLGRQSLIGDDAAFLGPQPQLAITADQQIADVHFPAGLDPARIARRLLAVNLSDLAACGARPAWAFLTLASPPGFDHRRFFRAFIAACHQFDVVLAGGDLARAATSSATLTLLGHRRRRGRWLRRTEARPGERLWVGGTLGESGLGRELLRHGAAWPAGGGVDLTGLSGARRALPPRLRTAARRAVRRHLAPVPQLALGAWLAGRRAGAAIDISDGLARDLSRLCRESGVGAEVDAAALPLAAEAATLTAALGLDPLELALGGGEDYVLLFTLPEWQRPPAELGARPIGRIVAGRRLALVQDGLRHPLPAAGWDHLAGNGGAPLTAPRRSAGGAGRRRRSARRRGS